MIVNIFRFIIGLILTLFIWDNSQSDLRIAFAILYFAYMVCATLYDVAHIKITIDGGEKVNDHN